MLLLLPPAARRGLGGGRLRLRLGLLALGVGTLGVGTLGLDTLGLDSIGLRLGLLGLERLEPPVAAVVVLLPLVLLVRQLELVVVDVAR